MSTPAQVAAKLSPALLEVKLHQSMQKAVLIAEGASKKQTPVKTGNLRRSETSRVQGGGMRIQGIVGTNMQYARFVHNGTRRMKARPFFDNGLAASRGQIVSVLQDAAASFLAGVK